VGIVNSDHIVVEDLALANNGQGVLFAGTTYSTIQNVVVSNNGHGIYLHSSSSNTISANTVSGNGYGIYLYYDSNSNTISGNTVSGISYGIYLDYSSSNTISGNTVSGNGYGIYLDYYSSSNTISGNTVLGNYLGIYLRSSSSNTINGNTVSGTSYGIYLRSSSSNTINGNTVSGTSYGITLYHSSSNTISGNTVLGNYYGILIYSYSGGNIIFHNNFIDNVLYYGSTNTWKTWHNNRWEGNYWSDYTGLDDGSGDRTANDGIGDTAIPHRGVDWYPLMNRPPEIQSITGPDPVQVNTEMSISGTYTDPDDIEIHTAVWSWGDDSTSVGTAEGGTATGSHTYDTAGVYTVTLTITDKGDESATMQYQYVVVYDPSGGFVTGGGWIDSPAGAYAPDPTLSGKANFGFVSKYKKGASEPTGNTQFQFKAGDLNFHSDTYQWLVIAGAKAQFKGTGTINGVEGYGFKLTAVDGAINGGGGTDKFRIKIWEIGTDTIVYDNQVGTDDSTDPATTLGGGSIVIHKAK
jgi:parallel beta-helix repeat protein